MSAEMQSESDVDEPEAESGGGKNQANPDSLSGLLGHFLKSTEGKEQVTISSLMDSLSSRSHGPMLLFPAIIAISPIGMIPGMSVVTGTLVILIAFQMMFFSSRPWIPERIRKFEFAREKLKSGIEKIQRWVDVVEKVIYQRLEFLVDGVMIFPIAVACILLAISFYPLAIVPFGVLVPGFAVTIFALGITARDGVLVLLGFLMASVAGLVLYLAWPF